MGQSYVHQLLWGLTPVLKMIPIYSVIYVLLWVHFMYTDYCEVLLLYINTSYIGRNIANQVSLSYHSSVLQWLCKTLYLFLSCVEAKKTTQSLWETLLGVVKKRHYHQKCCGPQNVLQCSKPVAKCTLHWGVKVTCSLVWLRLIGKLLPETCS